MQRIKTGDIALFRTSTPNIYSKMQMMSDRSPFSHCGIFYRDLGTDRLYIFETHQKYKDQRERQKNGYNLYPLEERVKNYHGEIYIKPLPNALNQEDLSMFNEFLNSHLHREDFPSNFQLFKNHMCRCYLGNKDIYPLNCAELVAYILNMGESNDSIKIGNIGCATPGYYHRHGKLKDLYQICNV
jgi:hypothetical protein